MSYRFVDADNHYYEPEDAFTRYMAKSDRGLAVRVAVREGKAVALVGERPFTFLSEMFYTHVGKPGGLREFLQHIEDGRVSSNPALVEVQPEFRDRDARLRLLDAQNVEACIMLPTLGVVVEHFMNADPLITYKNLRAFNRWLEDDWGFGTDGRIFGVPLLSLVDVDQAVGELDRVLERGAKVVNLRAGPAFGRSPGDPHFDPFWARINDARAVVAFHIGEAGYNESISSMWGETPNPGSHVQSAFQWTSFYGDRPVMDTMASLVYYNLFGRFPDVRVASIENGSLWIDYLIRAMDKMNRMGRNGPWPGGRLKEKPSETFRRHVFVAPYHEEDIPALVERVGSTQVLLGSDYPHPEGLDEPAAFADALASLDDETVRAIMRDNAAGLLGIPA